MKRKQLLNTVCLSVAVLLALALQWSDLHAARVVHHGNDAAYLSDDIRVWLDRDIDIYQPNDVLVFNVQAARDCYATVFAVDSEGYLHVIYPFSPDEDAWLQGGIVYSFTPMYNDIFFSAGTRGIAYVFAVASPSPFVYSQYDLGIFAGSWGYRVYGDPFVACRNFYFSLLPPRIVIERVSINFTYFYVREWVRYPRYLCYGTYYGRVHYGHPYQAHYASYCRDYRMHLHDPYSVISPTYRGGRRDGGHYSRVARVQDKHRRQIRARQTHHRDTKKAIRMETHQKVNKKQHEKNIRSKSQRHAGNRKDIARRPGSSVTTKSGRKNVTVKHTYRPEKAVGRKAITTKKTTRTVKTNATARKDYSRSVKTHRTTTTSKKAVVKTNSTPRKSGSTTRKVIKKSNQKQVETKQTTVTAMKDSRPKRQKSTNKAAVKKNTATKRSSKSRSQSRSKR